MSLGTGLNIVQCRTRKTTKAGQGHSPPYRKFGKNNARRCLFFGGGGGGGGGAGGGGGGGVGEGVGGVWHNVFL